MQDTYTDAFVGTMYTLHHQDRPVIVPIDHNAVVKAVTIDSKVKGDLYTALGVDVTKLKKAIASEITRGIASGLSYDDITRNIANTSSIPLKRAKTITRTEAGRIQEQATFDAANGALKAGADVVKQWSAIRDGKTRDTHRKLDGQVREVNEPFTVDGHKAMHPHGFGVAAEDVNCRCTMLTRARAALDADELKLLQERAAAHGLLVKDKKGFEDAKARDFADFKKKYLKAAEAIENQGLSRYNSDGELSRRTANTGAFANLSERMSKKHIREVAKDISVDLTGLALNLDTNEEMLGSGFAGLADFEKIGGITFFPDAFASREELIRTLIHEKTHVSQYREHGVAYVQEHRDRFEAEAYAAEDELIEQLKKEGKL